MTGDAMSKVTQLRDAAQQAPLRRDAAAAEEAEHRAGTWQALRFTLATLGLTVLACAPPAVYAAWSAAF